MCVILAIDVNHPSSLSSFFPHLSWSHTISLGHTIVPPGVGMKTSTPSSNNNNRQPPPPEDKPEQDDDEEEEEEEEEDDDE